MPPPPESNHHLVYITATPALPAHPLPFVAMLTTALPLHLTALDSSETGLEVALQRGDTLRGSGGVSRRASRPHAVPLVNLAAQDSSPTLLVPPCCLY